MINFIASATDSEMGRLYENCRDANPIRFPLEEMEHQ